MVLLGAEAGGHQGGLAGGVVGLIQGFILAVAAFFRLALGFGFGALGRSAGGGLFRRAPGQQRFHLCLAEGLRLFLVVEEALLRPHDDVPFGEEAFVFELDVILEGDALGLQALAQMFQPLQGLEQPARGPRPRSAPRAR